MLNFTVPSELSLSPQDTCGSCQQLTGARGSRSGESACLPSHTPGTWVKWISTSDPRNSCHCWTHKKRVFTCNTVVPGSTMTGAPSTNTSSRWLAAAVAVTAHRALNTNMKHLDFHVSFPQYNEQKAFHTNDKWQIDKHKLIISLTLSILILYCFCIIIRHSNFCCAIFGVFYRFLCLFLFVCWTSPALSVFFLSLWTFFPPRWCK